MKRLMILLPALMGMAMAQDFLVSFGDGGVKYRIVDSTCYSYVLNYPKDEKRLPNMLNNTIMAGCGEGKNHSAGLRRYRKEGMR